MEIIFRRYYFTNDGYITETVTYGFVTKLIYKIISYPDIDNYCEQ